MAGFVDQLAKRRAPGKPECDLTDQRQGQLVRESVVTDAAYFVAANLREAPSRQTLLSLATAVQPAAARIVGTHPRFASAISKLRSAADVQPGWQKAHRPAEPTGPCGFGRAAVHMPERRDAIRGARCKVASRRALCCGREGDDLGLAVRNAQRPFRSGLTHSGCTAGSRHGVAWQTHPFAFTPSRLTRTLTVSPIMPFSTP
jgi:hypothetical protein